MHTRYAPVRHSHGPEGPIPYDLHVLGLPLAFILSQDQTLRCTIDFLVLFFCHSQVRLRFLNRFLIRMAPRLTAFPRRHASVLASSYQRTCKLAPFLPSPRPVVCGCKSTTFFVTRNTFLKIFFLNSVTCCLTAKKRFLTGKNGRKTGENHSIFGSSASRKMVFWLVCTSSIVPIVTKSARIASAFRLPMWAKSRNS